MKFNEKLKVLRTEKGYTQEEIATKLNISRQSVSKWENGINEPDIETLKKICIIFNCSISDLIDDDKEVTNSKDKNLVSKIDNLISINIGVIIFSVLAIFSFITLLNKEVLINIRFDGTKDYGSKWSYLFLLILPTIMTLVSIVIKKRKNKNEIILKNDLVAQIIILIFNILITIGFIVLFYLVDEYNESKMSASVTLLALSTIIALALFSNPKFNKSRNSLFGFRTEFTLSNEEAWKKCNKFGSIVMFITSISIYVLNIILMSIFENFGVYSVFTILPIVLCIIPLMIYHEILKKRMLKKQ